MPAAQALVPPFNCGRTDALAALARPCHRLRAQHGDAGASHWGSPDRAVARSAPEPARGDLGWLRENPYFAYLALADAFMVTADSVSMISEAAATGNPVHILDLDGGNAKFARFHAAMQAAGITRPFTGRIESWCYPVPDDTARAGAALRGLVLRRLGARHLDSGEGGLRRLNRGAEKASGLPVAPDGNVISGRERIAPRGSG